MAFCSSCGHQLAQDAKFCSECGAKVDAPGASQSDQRKSVYDGEIHKCPNCGDVLGAFEAVCETCGYERRGAREIGSIRAFSLNLAAAGTAAQKANIIRSFYIPNNKEDILEFLMFSLTSIDGNVDKKVFKAWVAKVDQCYQKAMLVFKDHATLAEIESLHGKVSEKLKQVKGKLAVKTAIMAVILVIAIGWFPALMIVALNESAKEEEKETARLEAIIVEVREALENSEYKYALSLADSIDYQKLDAAMERKWDIKREYWVEKVLQEASENGITLDYTPTPDIDNANDESEIAQTGDP